MSMYKEGRNWKKVAAGYDSTRGGSVLTLMILALYSNTSGLYATPFCTPSILESNSTHLIQLAWKLRIQFRSQDRGLQGWPEELLGYPYSI